MTDVLTDRIEKAWEATPKGDYDDQMADLTQVAIREATAYFLPRAWTVEELRTLPIGTLVADADGDTWIRNECGMQLNRSMGQHDLDNTTELVAYAPQHITHLPKDA